MRHLTKKEIEELSKNKDVQNRLFNFFTMDGSEFFEEVRSQLSPQELEEYLEENPDEKIYMKDGDHTPDRPDGYGNKGQPVR